jgi:hypothetical protein
MNVTSYFYSITIENNFKVGTTNFIEIIDNIKSHYNNDKIYLAISFITPPSKSMLKKLLDTIKTLSIDNTKVCILEEFDILENNQDFYKESLENGFLNFAYEPIFRFIERIK